MTATTSRNHTLTDPIATIIMKKLFSTIILCGLLFTAFAQKAFKPIHFTSYMQTQKSLDFNGDKDGPEQHVSGMIQVNAKDSVFTISVDSQVALKLKILTIGDEFADGQYDKVVQLSCMDDAGKKYGIRIVRTKTSSYTYMKMYISPASTMIYQTYYCDYLKKLY
jgi:hypothetical protein